MAEACHTCVAGFYREYFTRKWTGYSIAILISNNAASMDRPTVANKVYQEACLSMNNTRPKVGKLTSTVLFYSNFILGFYVYTYIVYTLIHRKL